ncbi:hypothetical protein HAHE_16840 [Haloferula helveola]|uniref:Haem-binding domain-containing protein n=1 Tax=Haloferula helveola TaxID=490095 RepID=A0ABN6H2D6_9BACT|nr:hypothetical protein HAHE_16840 [Haloferula helveola]
MTSIPATTCLAGSLLCLTGPGLIAQSAKPTALNMPQEIEYLLEDYCWKCHDNGTTKGDIRLDNLTELPLDERLDLFNRMHEQAYLEHMPPKDEDDQPSAEERDKLIAWIAQDLKAHDAEKLGAKLKMPAYGNYVDHQKLFSGDYADLNGATPDRRWLISEYIFDAKFNRLLRYDPNRTIDGKRVRVIGDNNRRGVNLTNPFLLPTDSGVRYYDNTTLDGGHLLTMLTNAREASAYIMYLAERNRGNVFPAVHAIMKQEWEDEQTLAERERFLTDFMDQLLADIYDERRHQELLPAFVPVEVEPVEESEDVKKAGLHSANLGNEEMKLMYHTVLKHQDTARDDPALIRACEREWFNYGHSERQITMRVTFLHNYFDSWRESMVKYNYAQKNKPPVYKPRSDEEMEIIRSTIVKHRQEGDTYQAIISKCVADWKQGFEKKRVEGGVADDEQIGTLVLELFHEILEREPSPQDAVENFNLAKSYIGSLGNRGAVEKMIETLILNSDFVYRSEFGVGEADEHGRRMMSPRDAAYAISYALTDSSPDAELLEAAENGELRSREDYKREVTRLLSKRDQYYIIDEAVERQNRTANFTNLPIRKLRFFREFFGYPQMLSIFKDNKRFGGNYENSKYRMVAEADRLVEHILIGDEKVFEKLLTTEEFYVFHSGDNEAMTASSERIRKIYDHFKDTDWRNFENEDLEKHVDFLNEVEMRGVNAKQGFKDKGRQNSLRAFKTAMESFSLRLDNGEKAAAPFVSFPAHGPGNASTRTGFSLTGEEVAKSYNIDLINWDYPTNQPAKVEHRSGMLTHPAWLIAFARNTETDPIHRGKWIREKLLAGTIPDVPITVDAVVPEDHTKTMRTRLAERTEEAYCWKCHEHMNPLGNAFEMYDDFGRYRMEEFLEHPDNLIEKRPDKGQAYEDLRDIYKTLPVVSTGRLEGTDDPELDGEVEDGIELARRLAKSDRVRQSIIRHAFRYFMGRNETLSDSKTLIDADQAYLESGGSFDAVIVSLLTSDSFLYRISTKN